MKNVFLLVITILILTACEHDSFTVENNQTQDIQRSYGISSYKSFTIESFGDITLYTPKNISTSKDGVPIVLFAPGWGSKNYLSYKAILTFIAQQGYVVIFSNCPQKTSPKTFVRNFLNILEDEKRAKNFDKTKIGVVGYSSGGGLAFGILKELYSMGYGSSSRFIFSMAPWFAFEMNERDFYNLPEDTKVIIQQYSNDFTTDPRIPLTIYSKLENLGDENRDYQLYYGVDHWYPTGDKPYSRLQYILRPLDALMAYTFKNDIHAYENALLVGDDQPQKNQKNKIYSSDSYEHKCYGEYPYLHTILNLYDIDYCSIIK